MANELLGGIQADEPVSEVYVAAIYASIRVKDKT